MEELNAHCGKAGLGFTHNYREGDEREYKEFCIVVAGPNHSLSMQEEIPGDEVESRVTPRIEALKTVVEQHKERVQGIRSEKTEIIARKKAEAEAARQAEAERKAQEAATLREQQLSDLREIEKQLKFAAENDLPLGADLAVYVENGVDTGDHTLDEYLTTIRRNGSSDKDMQTLVSALQSRFAEAEAQGIPINLSGSSRLSGGNQSDIIVIAADGSIKQPDRHEKWSGRTYHKTWQLIDPDDLVISWSQYRESGTDYCDTETQYRPQNLTSEQLRTVGQLERENEFGARWDRSFEVGVANEALQAEHGYYESHDDTPVIAAGEPIQPAEDLQQLRTNLQKIFDAGKPIPAEYMPLQGEFGEGEDQEAVSEIRKLEQKLAKRAAKKGGSDQTMAEMLEEIGAAQATEETKKKPDFRENEETIDLNLALLKDLENKMKGGK